MPNQIDLTYAVMTDGATEKALSFVADLCKDYSPDIVETALERALLEIKDTKERLYASALLQTAGQDPQEEQVTKTGTVEEMAKDLANHGVNVEMK